MKRSSRKRTGTNRSGTYVLVLRLPSRARIAVGKLGRFELRAGFYCYVGSAFGPGGLFSRLAHHLRRARRPHWHVDHLRRVARVEAVWYTLRRKKQEHRWAAILRSMPGASIAIPRFGSSDCNCPGHLLYFRDRPRADPFVGPLGARRVERL